MQLRQRVFGIDVQANVQAAMIVNPAPVRPGQAMQLHPQGENQVQLPPWGRPPGELYSLNRDEL